MRLDHLKLPPIPRHWSRSWMWREWCFWRVLVGRFRWRIAAMLTLLAAGTIAFVLLDPACSGDAVRALYFTWTLVFGQPPHELPPDSAILRALFFVVPVAGVTLVIETIVQFALAVRDRTQSERNWCSAMAHSLSDHIVIVGMGRLGYSAYRLLRRLGQAIVVIEARSDNQFLDTIRRHGSPLLIADARRDAALIEANIGAARSIICATDDDLANLEIALDARRLNSKVRVVMRMFDQNMADKIREAFNIRLAMSQAALSAPSFAMAAMDATIANTLVVDDELVVMQRWQVRHDGPLAGRSVGDCLRELRFAVVKRQPKNGPAILFPPADVLLETGDALVVQGTFGALVAIRGQKLSLT